MNPALTQAPSYPMARLDELKEQLRAQGKPLYDFGVGDPAEQTPAFIREALRAAIPEVSRYPTVSGRPELRRAAAGYLERRFGVKLDPGSQLLPTGGSKEAIFHLALALVDPRSEKRVVLYPDPGYPVYERGARFAGAEPCPVALEEKRGFLLEPAQIPEALLKRTALLWVNYPHNPTGAVADRAYYRRLLEAARAYGFVVASDECYVDLFFEQQPPSLLEEGVSSAIAFFSTSKRSGMTGYRSGFMAGDASILAALKKMRPNMGVASPEFIQAAATQAWSDDAHAEQRRKVFAEKRELFLRFFREIGLQIPCSRATFFLWIKVPPGQTSEGYARALLEKGIVVSPGTFFGAGEGYVRLALVPTLEECRQAIEAWRTVR